MESTPRISVIMSVYNSAPFLREAVDSILNQTFGDFEFLIVDDKSTDGSLEILKSYSDNRVQIFENQENIGLTKSLNILLKIAKGEFIARMDADDISLPKRFEKQINYFENNKKVILLGAQYKLIGNDSIISNFPLKHNAIAANLIFENCFAHPATIFKRKIDTQVLYNDNYEVAQDYELWTRLVFKGIVNNLSEALIIYRQHDTNIGKTKSILQTKNTQSIKQEYQKKVLKVVPFYLTSDQHTEYLKEINWSYRSLDLKSNVGFVKKKEILKFYIIQLLKKHRDIISLRSLLKIMFLLGFCIFSIDIRRLYFSTLYRKIKVIN